MIQIKPVIEHHSSCPHCGAELSVNDVLWQGIHVCAITRCSGCSAEIIEDLPVGQAIYLPYQVDLEKNLLYGSDIARQWLGGPLLESLQSPKEGQEIAFTVERCMPATNVVILNCIDYLYGHSLLKLLNAQALIDSCSGPSLVIIVPQFLRWLVPEGVAEIWTVGISLKEAQNFYPQLDRRIKGECERFNSVYVSPAFSHPRDYDISRFTRVSPHDFNKESFRVTFIWREDRPWWEKRIVVRIASRLRGMRLLLLWQNIKVRRLFSLLRRKMPDVRFTVAGLGRSTSFPAWIEDRRVARFSDAEERRLSAVYAESRLVIGVHGSSMLLPSAHAGMTIDLMPMDRWSNFAQDVLYQEADPRLASYRYRYIPLEIDPVKLAQIAAVQVKYRAYFEWQMTNELRGAE